VQRPNPALRRMATAVAIGLCLLYLAGVLAGAPIFGSTMTPWFLAGWSAAFVWGYLTLARGRRITALSIVTVVTVLLPVVALIGLVGPLFRSPSAMFGSLWSEFRGRGSLGGVELFLPLLAASGIVFLVGRADSHAKPD
jgi:hypothetical protein